MTEAFKECIIFAVLCVAALVDGYYDSSELGSQCLAWAMSNSWAWFKFALGFTVSLCLAVALWRQSLRVLYYEIFLWVWIWKTTRDLGEFADYPSVLTFYALLMVVFLNLTFVILSIDAFFGVVEDQLEEENFLVAVATPVLHVLFMLVYQQAWLQPIKGLRFHFKHLLIAANLITVAELCEYMLMFSNIMMNDERDVIPWEAVLVFTVHLVATIVWFSSVLSAIAIVFGVNLTRPSLLGILFKATSHLMPERVKELMHRLLVRVLKFV